jgi:hypothetical protein
MTLEIKPHHAGIHGQFWLSMRARGWNKSCGIEGCASASASGAVAFVRDCALCLSVHGDARDGGLHGVSKHEGGNKGEAACSATRRRWDDQETKRCETNREQSLAVESCPL